MQNSVALEMKNVESQFSELTEGAPICVINQSERLLTTCYRVSYCVFFLARTTASEAAVVNR
jgi:hypothetical protein